MHVLILSLTLSLVSLAGSSPLPEDGEMAPLPPLPSGCMYNGKEYPEGDFQDGPCTPCMCHRGHVACAAFLCAPPPCFDHAFVPDQCCPICPNGPNCKTADGTEIHGEEEVEVSPGKTCRCAGGPYFNHAVCTRAFRPRNETVPAAV